MHRAAALALASALIVLTLPAHALQTPPGPGGMRGTPIRPGESCPPGTTEIRPLRCQAPELPAPSIVDYRPRSTLVTPAHQVPRAKYPVIDFHGHPQGLLASADGLLGSAREWHVLLRFLFVTPGLLPNERRSRRPSA